jgi:hypothetical protein
VYIIHSTFCVESAAIAGMQDFKGHVRRQVKFIRNSCAFYDQGDVEEAVRIAVASRVLFHDSTHSVSLLTHLGSNSISMLTTAAPFVDDPPMPNLYLVQPVVDIRLTNDNRTANMRCPCYPLLNRSMRNDSIPFSKWWAEELVIEHKEPPSLLTRKNLVLAAANKDGGAHVDEELHPTYDYARLGSGVEIEIHFKPEWALPAQKAAYENVQFATLRQIAYEVLNSPALLALA